MRKYMVIYNPSAGKESAAQKIFHASRMVMAEEEIEFTFYATKKKGDGTNAAIRGCLRGYDMIISCGGDGTVHEVVNGMMKCNELKKLAILPAGTINDFAEQLNIPKTSTGFADLMLSPNYKTVDAGKINSSYFINVVSGGAFTNIPHLVTTDAKNVFGKYAYYFQAAVEIPGQLEKSYNIKYTIDEAVYFINTYLFLISNTPGAGGFRHLCPDAKFDDGILDIVIFEKSSPTDLIQIFTGVFNGQHVNHPKVHYMQAKNIRIESEEEMILDVDGEKGSCTPVSITSVHNAIDILVPKM